MNAVSDMGPSQWAAGAHCRSWRSAWMLPVTVTFTTCAKDYITWRTNTRPAEPAQRRRSCIPWTRNDIASFNAFLTDLRQRSPEATKGRTSGRAPDATLLEALEKEEGE
jgi:hypothetical protein